MRSLIVMVWLIGCSAANGNFRVVEDASPSPSPRADGGLDDGGRDGGEPAVDLAREVDGSQAVDLAPAQNDAGSDLAPNVDLLPASCALPGACAPGSQQASADGCSTRECTMLCQWGAWGFKQGYTCSTGSARSCLVDPSCSSDTGKETCTSCNWGPCLCQ